MKRKGGGRKFSDARPGLNWTGLLCLLIPILLLTGSAFCADPVVEPEFSDIFFRLDSGKLLPLERETATIHGKAGGFIVVNMKAASEFPGVKSPVRAPENQPLVFVVRTLTATTAMDPNVLYTLRKLNVKKKTRELVMMSGRAVPFSVSTKSDLAQGALPVEFAKYGASSLKMTTAPLPPGEYAVSRVGGQTVFCFGVD